MSNQVSTRESGIVEYKNLKLVLKLIIWVENRMRTRAHLPSFAFSFISVPVGSMFSYCSITLSRCHHLKFPLLSTYHCHLFIFILSNPYQSHHLNLNRSWSHHALFALVVRWNLDSSEQYFILQPSLLSDMVSYKIVERARELHMVEG